jgi:hypothetical protein
MTESRVPQSPLDAGGGLTTHAEPGSHPSDRPWISARSDRDFADLMSRETSTRVLLLVRHGEGIVSAPCAVVDGQKLPL